MTDYRKAKASALQALAAAGDKAAMQELERRGVERGAVVDMAELDYQGLRSFVIRWNEGTTPEDRARSRQLAELAQEELEVRFTVDQKLYDGSGPEPREPPVPPWRLPPRPRTESWQRPTGSTLYPSDTDRLRAELGKIWRQTIDSGRRAASEGDDDV